MKINNETKVGILAIVSVLLLVLGFNFLKGKSLFSKTPVIYAVFQKLGSLEKSNLVKINGLPIGTVYDFKPIDKEISGIIVEIHLNRDINIPKNSAALIDKDIVGSSYITVEKGTATTYLQSGDTISTRLDPSLLTDIKTQLTPTITRVNETLDSLKISLGKINAVFDPSTNNNLQSTIANLALSSSHLQRLLNTETGMLAGTLANVNSVTGNLAKNNDQINQSIRNVELTTSNLANAPIQQTVAALQSTIAELQGTAQQVKAMVGKFNTNNGTLGMLMNDRKLYDQLNKVSLSAEILLDDLRLHPKRYVNISVFGAKSKPDPLTSPAQKDTLLLINK
jgi:phospholipid/cholesterol/gamma-HCH transport system substrate-binding protein